MKAVRWLLLVFVGLLVACGGPVALPQATNVEPGALPSPTGPALASATAEEGPDDGDAWPASPSPEPAATAAATDTVTAAATQTGGREAVFPNTIIVYQREGRFPDSPQKWTFYRGGRIVAGDGSEWQVPVESVAPLFEAVEAPAFQNLAGKYAPAGECLDCPVHTLTVYYQGKIKEVTVVRETPDVPEALRLVLDTIDSVLSSP